MSYRKQFLMTPGGKIFLKDLDPDFSDKKDDKKSAGRKIKKLQQRMDRAAVPALRGAEAFAPDLSANA